MLPGCTASSCVKADTDTSCPTRFESIIFDLGGVLFTWTASTTTHVSPHTLQRILRSASWFEYEKGIISEQEAYDAAASEYNLRAEDVRRAFDEARASLQLNERLVAFIRELRARHSMRVFVMSNISVPDLEYLRGRWHPEDLALFDRVFASGAVHKRKPNLGFYRHVIDVSGLDPTRTIIIDDKIENVVSARSLGFKGIVYTSDEALTRQLRNCLEDPTVRAQRWMRENAKEMPTVSNTGMTVRENFIPMLILEATGDRSLVDFIEYDRYFNVFIGAHMFIHRAPSIS